MERLTKRYNERTGTYEYVDAFSGADMFDGIIKGITSKFVKDRAKTLGTKPLEAGVNKVGAEIGKRTANKVISVVDKKFSKPLKEVKYIIYKEAESDDEKSSLPLGNITTNELNKKSDNLTSTNRFNLILYT